MGPAGDDVANTDLALLSRSVKKGVHAMVVVFGRVRRVSGRGEITLCAFRVCLFDAEVGWLAV